MDEQRPARRTYYNRLNAADKAKVDKGCRVGGRVLAIVIAVCILGVCHLAAHVWHWPLWLGYTLAPLLGAAVALFAIVAPFWALERWAARQRRKRPPVTGPEQPPD